MDFTVEFYETGTGKCPVREFLDELKASDPDDFAAVVAGLAKLRNRQYHREPLSRAIGDGLFELRHVGKLNRVMVLHEGSADRRGPRHSQQGPSNPGPGAQYCAGAHA